MLHMGRCRAARIVAVALAIACVTPGAVLAADPVTTSDKAGPGVRAMPANVQVEQLGYTKDQQRAKLAALEQFKAAKKAGVIRTGGATAMTTTALTSDFLTGWRTLHQKQNNWCLSALVENILWYEVGDYYISGGTYAWQKKIDAVVQKQEKYALPYINGQFKTKGVNWTYIAYTPASASELTSAIQYDVTQSRFPTYVRVNVASTFYVWHQRDEAWHATAGVGWSNSGSNATIADPFTSPDYYPYCRTGVHSPGYSSTPTYGCTYNGWRMGDYYQSIPGTKGIWF